MRALLWSRGSGGCGPDRGQPGVVRRGVVVRRVRDVQAAQRRGAQLGEQRPEVQLGGERVRRPGAEHQRHREPGDRAGGEAVEEQLEQTGVRRLVGRARHDHQLGGRDPGHQLGHLRVLPVEQRRPEGGQVDHEVGGLARELRRDVLRGGEGARGRLRVADEHRHPVGARHEAALVGANGVARGRLTTGCGWVQSTALGQHRQDALAEPVGAFEVRVRREHELVDAQRVVLLDPVGDLLVAAHQRGAGAPADQADAGPDVGVDDEVVALAAVQLEHPALALGLAAAQALLHRRRACRRRCRRAAGRPPPTPRPRCRG